MENSFVYQIRVSKYESDYRIPSRHLCADVTDIADGASAKIKIVEKDNDGNDDFSFYSISIKNDLEKFIGYFLWELKIAPRVLVLFFYPDFHGFVLFVLTK